MIRIASVLHITLLLVNAEQVDVSVRNETEAFLFKCCQEGEAFDLQGNCVKKALSFDVSELYLDEPQENVTLVTGIMNCTEGRYRLEPQDDPDDVFNLLPDGRLTLPSQKDAIISHLDFCLEYFQGEDGNYTLLPLVCFPPPQVDDAWKAFTFIAYPIGCLLSVPGLIGTVIVYLDPRMKTTHGKILVCHCSCLTVAFLSLVSLQFQGHDLPQTICVFLGFLVQFSFVASFVWLNILCIHLYRRIKKLRERILKTGVWSWCREEKITQSNRSRDFLYYSIYGWLGPTVVVGVSLFADMSPSLPSTFLKPNFGVNKCWFSSNETALRYFYLPLAMVFITNIILFILTARIVHKHHSVAPEKKMKMVDAVDAMMKKNKLLNLRKSLVQCCILFMAMGLNWLSEVISFVFGGHIWILTDLINTFQGIAIFLIFVWHEKNAKNVAKERLFCRRRSRAALEQHPLKGREC